MRIAATIALVPAVLLGGCVSTLSGETPAARPVQAAQPVVNVALIGGAQSDRRLLAASEAARRTELASTSTSASATTGGGGLPTQRPRNDKEEVGAAFGSTSWKINRDPVQGQGELCAIQNYYLAPKATR